MNARKYLCKYRLFKFVKSANGNIIQTTFTDFMNNYNFTNLST